jgi:Fe-Mn family superoxide dismutase
MHPIAAFRCSLNAAGGNSAAQMPPESGEISGGFAMIQVDRRTLMLGAAAVGTYATVKSPYVFAQTAPAGGGPFALPPLGYAPNKNEPHIDTMTMEIHHGRHHQAFITNLNNAAKDNAELFKKPIQELIGNLNSVPDNLRTLVRNNGGGHANHAMFWQVMGGSGGEPSGAVADAIKSDLGGFAKLQEDFNGAGVRVFGSGWVFVASDKAGKLSLVSKGGQDNPLMDGLMPIFGNDVWEHAYYLKYQNRRADYLKSWWNVVDWAKVNERYAAAKGGKFTI